MKNDAPAYYFITDRCIACGTCLAVCRENCIAGGRPPFVIRRSCCVRCGLCAAKCPVKAIVRIGEGVLSSAPLG